jgi:hypothetical protein
MLATISLSYQRFQPPLFFSTSQPQSAYLFKHIFFNFIDPSLTNPCRNLQPLAFSFSIPSMFFNTLDTFSLRILKRPRSFFFIFKVLNARPQAVTHQCECHPQAIYSFLGDFSFISSLFPKNRQPFYSTNQDFLIQI